MVDGRMEALAERQHGVISYRQARAAGVTHAKVRARRESGRWEDLSYGVYRIVGAAPSAQQRAMAAVLGGGTDAVLSHTSAAALLALPGFSIEPVVITVPRRRRAIAGVRIEQSLCVPPHHCRIVDSIPSTSIARTLFDLCGDVNAHRAERALDTALARKRVTIPALWRVLDDLAVQGRKGVVLLRLLLTERGGRYVPPESELEQRFIDLLRGAGLPQPSRQVDLGDADRWLGRFDFVWRESRVVVEVDGAAFHDGHIDRARDTERAASLEALGWTVFRFRWSEVVDDPAAVLTALQPVFGAVRGR
jgi:hypothetical protein